VLTGVIQQRLSQQIGGKYFTWNFRFIATGMLLTFLYGLSVVVGSLNFGSVFLVFWSFFFFQTFGAIIAATFAANQRHWLKLVLFTAVFSGATLLALREIARHASWPAVLSYAAMMVLNSIFIPLLRTPTAAGRELQKRAMGYKQFLETAEQQRLNTLGKTYDAAPHVDSLPYAIALGVREAWGDALADILSTATVSR
jgi:hypothetical protein